MSVEQLELLRKKAKKSCLTGIFITIGVTIVAFLLTNLAPVAVVCLVMGIVITFISSSAPSKEFISAFKETFVLKSLNSVFTDLNYTPEEGIPESVIRDTQMMDMGDRYYSNDYISAKYKDINVVQSDVHIEEERETTDSDGNTTTTWVTIFRGRWMIFDFNKTFKANIQVCQKGFGNAQISNWGTALKYKKVLMEDQDFNNNFRIYAQSEHEAFYILTPALMEKIKRLTSSIYGSVLLCFIDNKLHVGIQNNRDSFEHSIFTKIDENKVTEEISKDIKLITSFVDELDLDNDLFRKEV